ncbi:MAG: hypothetical protein KF713_18615 [Turneriella sp.]|nr:hypothetical protein [Turneriella sp.]
MRFVLVVGLLPFLLFASCKGAGTAAPGAATAGATAPGATTSAAAAGDRQAIFLGSPEETLKPTIWDTGDTTVTNEDRLEIYEPHIRGIGGGYFGVGSIQNFTLAAWARSEYIWLMDFTRVVVAANKIHTAFLKRLKTPAEHRLMWDKKKSAAAADKIFDEEFKGSDELPFIKESYRKASGYLIITFGFLDKLTKKRPYKFWLNDQEQYDYLKGLALAGRIRALRGDLNGPTTVTGIATAAKQMGVPLRILYYSNAEEYFKGYKEPFKKSFSQMPVDDKSFVVRTISFNKGKFRWAEDSDLSTDRGFHYSLQPATEFVEALKLAQVDVRDFYKTALIDPKEYGLSWLGSLAEKKRAAGK